MVMLMDMVMPDVTCECSVHTVVHSQSSVAVARASLFALRVSSERRADSSYIMFRNRVTQGVWRCAREAVAGAGLVVSELQIGHF